MKFKKIAPFLVLTLGVVIASLLASCPAEGQEKKTFLFDAYLLGQVRFLYGGLDVEMLGCLYGQEKDEVVYLAFLVPASQDPLTATDSTSNGIVCPLLKGIINQEDSAEVAPLAMFHTHIRGGGSNCFMSQEDWGTFQAAPIPYSVIMCSAGDTLIFFDKNGKSGRYGLPSPRLYYPWRRP